MKLLYILLCVGTLFTYSASNGQCPTLFAAGTNSTLTTGQCDPDWLNIITVRNAGEATPIGFFQDGCDYNLYHLRDTKLISVQGETVGYTTQTNSNGSTFRNLYDCQNQKIILWEEENTSVMIQGESVSVQYTFYHPTTSLVIGYGQVLPSGSIVLIDTDGNELSRAHAINPLTSCASNSWNIITNAQNTTHILADPLILPFVVSLRLTDAASLSACGIATRAGIISGTIGGSAFIVGLIIFILYRCGCFG